jgi:ABC-type sugar transport system ATPase subunit
MNMTAILDISNVCVRFESFALKGISLKIETGDYLALLGLSGAGKTVLLEVLAGLIAPEQGVIKKNGKDITRQRIQDRGIGLVYQDLSLFPHLDVYKNIAFALKSKGLSAAVIRRRVEELAWQTEVGHLLSRYPGTLSGGEAQRVALARTLAADPDILLLDEPLSNLDVKLKTGLRALLRRIHQSGKTMIHVTHDYMEAATLANKVAVIEEGSLIQHGRPEEVFRHPASEFVARFSGVKNLFPCKVERSEDARLNIARVHPDVSISYLGSPDDEEGFVMLAQEDILISIQPLESSAVNQFRGTISEIYLSGHGMEMIVRSGVEYVVSISRLSVEKLGLQPGMLVYVVYKASSVRFVKS